MLNWFLRYEPIMQVLDDRGAETVLDVGSGWYGLSWYADRTVVQTDLHFAAPAPATGRVGSAHFVCASAERLPFADGSFDWVLSSDMFEHLPEQIRAPSVSELARVARRGVIIGFPQGLAARRVDRVLARLLRLARRPLPGWLVEHLAQRDYPSRAAVEAALPDGWSIAADLRNGNAFLQLLVIAAEMLPGLRRLTATLERCAISGGVPGLVHIAPTVRALYVVEPVAGRSEQGGPFDRPGVGPQACPARAARTDS